MATKRKMKPVRAWGILTESGKLHMTLNVVAEPTFALWPLAQRNQAGGWLASIAALRIAVRLLLDAEIARLGGAS